MLTAVGEIDAVDIPHEFQRLLLADVFVQGSAEIIRDVIFAVRESACAAESAHDRA